MDGMSLCCCQKPVGEAGEDGHSGRRNKGTRESLSSAKGPFKVYMPGTADCGNIDAVNVPETLDMQPQKFHKGNTLI